MSDSPLDFRNFISAVILKFGHSRCSSYVDTVILCGLTNPLIVLYYDIFIRYMESVNLSSCHCFHLPRGPPYITVIKDKIIKAIG